MSLTTIYGLLITFLLATAVNSVNWQGSGTINSTVISKVWAHINANLSSAITLSGSQMSNNPKKVFCKTLSDEMNALWDPAWNVLLISGEVGYDTILYGYAFRNQWMWHNGITIPGYAFVEYAIIVWKDYNCQTWSQLPELMNQMTFTTNQVNLIKAETAKVTSDQITNNIWGAAHTLVTAIEQKSDFLTGGYTIIMGQRNSYSAFGYICMVSGHFYDSGFDYPYGIAGNSQGRYFLFETRQGGGG